MGRERANLLLSSVGARVRARRQGRGWSRAALARSSGVSVRFLAQLEGGRGNISLGRLADVAAALETTPAQLLVEAEGEPAPPLARAARGEAPAPRRPLVALLGLRGAGKSTVGPALAARLGLRFVEIDALVERAAGMPLGALFELHGSAYYRRLERETLARLLAEREGAVLATGGGLVTEPRTFELLCAHAVTVWLRARPEDHWRRVVAQGDQRPMAERPDAMAELRALLSAREPLYAGAAHVVDTSRLSVSEAVDAIARAVAPTSPRAQ